MSEQELGRKNRQRLRVDMSEVDFMSVVISHPNRSKPPFCIIEYKPIMKNVERTSIFLKYIFRSRIITWIYRDIDLIWVKWILQRLLYDFQSYETKSITPEDYNWGCKVEPTYCRQTGNILDVLQMLVQTGQSLSLLLDCSGHSYMKKVWKLWN